MAAASEAPSPAREWQSRPQQQAPALLSIWGLSCRTPAGVPIVQELSLELPAAGALLVEGPSACGKSTLLQVLAGLRPSCGGNYALPPPEQVGTSVEFVNGNPWPIKVSWQFMFQNYQSDELHDFDGGVSVIVMSADTNIINWILI